MGEFKNSVANIVRLREQMEDCIMTHTELKTVLEKTE